MSPIESQLTQARAARRGAGDTALLADVYAYYRAVNEGRVDDLLAMFHDDAVLIVPTARELSGAEALRAYYERAFGCFPEHCEDVALVTVDGGRAMALTEFSGTDSLGERASWWVGATFTFDGDRMRQLRLIYDTAAMPAWARERLQKGIETEAGG